MAPDKHLINIHTQIEHLPWYLAGIGVIAAKLHVVQANGTINPDVMGVVWKLVITILIAMGSLSMFLAGLGYYSVDRRLCIIEHFVRTNDNRLDIVEKYQDMRIEKEHRVVPTRPQAMIK